MTTVVKTITFNTGREYSADGQTIKATLYSDSVVTFMDHARKVDGSFEIQEFDEFTRDTVMYYYDRGLCSNNTRSFNDGMLRNGANTL